MICWPLFLTSTGITIDSRKIEKGQLYFALKGANFDGNKFSKQALEQGAAYAIVDDKALEGIENHIYVEDSLKALQDLSTAYRQKKYS